MINFEKLEKDFEFKINLIGKNFINSSFYKTLRLNLNGVNLFSNVSIYTKNKKTIISSKKEYLLKIKYFLEKKYSIISNLKIKDLILEIENFDFKIGENKIKNIIKILKNDNLSFVRNLLLKEKKLIKNSKSSIEEKNTKIKNLEKKFILYKNKLKL
ncbi:hypothetical protein [Candidatus Vidania fulgoroideorum]